MIQAEKTSLALRVRIDEKRYDNMQSPVLQDLIFDVGVGEIVSVVGPSGCGKSTLLRIIAGLDQAFRGSVISAGRKQNPEDSCGFVFQDARLLPWYTVAENIDFGIPRELSGLARMERLTKVLHVTHLEPYSGRLPQQISGGMQKLTAMARALAVMPTVMLLDEPFSSLDPSSRYRLHDQVLELQNKSKFAIILVTHDVDEAVYLSDRILVLGGSPTTVVKTQLVRADRPRDRFSSELNKLRTEILSSMI